MSVTAPRKRAVPMPKLVQPSYPMRSTFVTDRKQFGRRPERRTTVFIPQIVKADQRRIGSMGQAYLASGCQVSMRRWEGVPGDWSETTCRSYEVVGYIIEGAMVIDLDGSEIVVEAGDSWHIPQCAPHRYRILEPIVVIEATSPAAELSHEDESENNLSNPENEERGF